MKKESLKEMFITKNEAIVNSCFSKQLLLIGELLAKNDNCIVFEKLFFYNEQIVLIERNENNTIFVDYKNGDYVEIKDCMHDLISTIIHGIQNGTKNCFKVICYDNETKGNEYYEFLGIFNLLEEAKEKMLSEAFEYGKSYIPSLKRSAHIEYNIDDSIIVDWVTYKIIRISAIE